MAEFDYGDLFDICQDSCGRMVHAESVAGDRYDDACVLCAGGFRPISEADALEVALRLKGCLIVPRAVLFVENGCSL